MTEQSLIVDTTQRIFRELGDPQVVRTHEQRERLWEALESAGLTRAWLAESLNGSGSSVADGFDILSVAGASAVNVPLAETLLASWLLGRASMTATNGVIAVAPTRCKDRIGADADKRLTGRLSSVPFAREAAYLVTVVDRGAESVVALVDRRDCAIDASMNIAGDASDTVTLHAAPAVYGKSAVRRVDFELMGAAIRATQMAGALQTVLDLSVAYANDRVAFEKPIGKFQAIQHSLAKLAGETAAALAAAGSATDAIAAATQFDDAVFLEVASAKIRVGEAVTAGAAIAHQLFGAIGFSQEHVLRRYTQRLWSWRDDFGSEVEWSVRLGHHVASRGAEALWPMLAAR